MNQRQGRHSLNYEAYCVQSVSLTSYNINGCGVFVEGGGTAGNPCLSEVPSAMRNIGWKPVFGRSEGGGREREGGWAGLMGRYVCERVGERVWNDGDGDCRGSAVSLELVGHRGGGRRVPLPPELEEPTFEVEPAELLA